MSQVPSTSTASTNFETIFAAALIDYKKQTKRDISTHPLSTQLQSCDSPGAVLEVLRARIHKFDQSQRADEKWAKWVNPTVRVLHAFSVTLGSGAGLVFARPPTSQGLFSDLCDHRYSHPQTQFSPALGSFSK
jgi:hypothetical protein